MHTVHLGDLTAEAVAELLGGTVIMVDVTNNTAMISGIEETVLDIYGLRGEQ